VTVVAGYTASSASGSLNTNVTLNAQRTTFYWVFAASSQVVTFTLKFKDNLNNSLTATAQATFNVTGPTNGTMTSTAYNQLTIADWTGANNPNCISPAGPYLLHGNYVYSSGCVIQGTRGISFSGSVTGGTGGSILLVQLINSGSISGGRSCTVTAGLDPAGYPYPYTNDSPAALLQSTYTTLSRTENFTMYMMWQSNTSNSTIPVPIGYQQWGFQGSANCSASCGSASNWTATTQSAGLQGGFVAAQSSQTNYGYPTWTVTGGGCN
jgi:hypothetical protein